jgi:phosphatidylserine decarboxylase
MYLSPQDYHRVHTPLDVEVDGYKYIKGKLFPVNAISVENINELFSINERVLFKLKNEQINEFALVMVGATNVGSISLSFDDLKTNKLIQKDIDKTYNKKPHLKKGEELGIFHMGSTVIMLFQKDSIKFEKLFISKKMKMGEEVATII